MVRFAGGKAALLPAFAPSDRLLLQRTLDQGGPPLERLIRSHQLAPLWAHCSKAPAFNDDRLHATLLYLKQLAAIRGIDETFARAGVAYAVIKGAATRALVYPDPALRLCADIDVLVAPDQRVEAARALWDAGYRWDGKPLNVSHEIQLIRDSVSIDLHWDILRPGRTRVPIVDALLARRRRHDDFWLLADDDALFLMLVHGAISKHVSTSGLGLHRAADIALWCQHRRIDWQAVLDRVAACGLKSAAWATLYWVRLLSPDTFGDLVAPAVASMRPGRLRTAYLGLWLHRDLTSRLAHVHVARLLGFSMFLHDTPADAWRALRGWRQARRTSADDALVFRDVAGQTAGVRQ